MIKTVITFPRFEQKNLFFWVEHIKQMGCNFVIADKMLSVLISKRQVLDFDVSLTSVVTLVIFTHDASCLTDYLDSFKMISKTVEIYEEEPRSLLSQYHSGSHISVDQTKEKYINYKIDCTRDDFHDQVVKTIDLSNIDVVEFGVYVGDSMKKWTSAFTNLTNKFYGFDTFSGIQEKWITSDNIGYKVVMPMMCMDLHNTAPDETGSLKDSRVHYIKGMVQETLINTLTKISNDNKRFYHFDMDTYSGTLYALSHASVFFKSGDFILFDEFFDPLNEWLAWNDFNRSHLFLKRWEPILHNGEQILFKINDC